ncbi:MAG: Hpt domain-containing protein [Lachnospiraceae bacterium]|nr:Hpt domain-containing protein [Lachnospiraceae bacterium]
MLTIEKLIDYGADVKAGMEICMNNEEFYFRMINLMLADNQVENLQRAVEEGNLDEAFEAAHALKGVTANLGLTPIRTPVTEMTELLRARTDMDYSQLMDEIKKQKETLAELAK